MVILSLIFLFIFIRGRTLNQGMQFIELNKQTLMFAKCWTTCPYAEIERDGRESVSRHIPECVEACREKYLFQEEDYKNISDPFSLFPLTAPVKDILLYNVTLCYISEINEKQDFKECINNLLEEKKELIDLSNFTPEIEYEIVDIEIINFNCLEGGAEVDIILRSGEIEEMDLMFSEEGNSQTLDNLNLPNKNLTTHYSIDYSEKNITISPDEVQIIVKYKGRFIDKGKEQCKF